MTFDPFSALLGQVIGKVFGVALDGVIERWKLDHALNEAIRRAMRRFQEQYRSTDPELATTLLARLDFIDAPTVRNALHEMLKQPFDDPSTQMATIHASFAEVLPEQADRSRVDAAVRAFLAILGNEVIRIPQLQPMYSLLFQRTAAEQSVRSTTQTTELTARIAALNADIHRLISGEASVALPVHGSPSAGLRHNLPQPDYARFVGREQELAWLNEHLLASDGSGIVLIIGIGGVGKSALAIAAGHQLRERYAELPSAERFEAIVWVSAKEEVLTPGGTETAAPAGLIFRTLDDIYAAIAQALDREDITRALLEARDRLVQQALSAQRTLLIIDNFETVADERVRAFLRQLPSQTRVLITSREWLDVGPVLRLGSLAPDDAISLIAAECAAREVLLNDAQQRQLAERTGGLPLPIRLSVARLAGGESLASVLRWLDEATGELPAYCVQGQVDLAHSRNPDSWRLLLAVALFDQRAGAPRNALGIAADLNEDARDTGLALLQRLSLIVCNCDDRFWMLPIVQGYALANLAADPDGESIARRWITWAVEFATHYGRTLSLCIEQHETVRTEYPNLRAAIRWCRDHQLWAPLLALVDGCWFFAELAGLFGELREMADAASVAADTLDDIAGQARMAYLLGWIGRLQGLDLDEVAGHLGRAALLARKVGDDELLAEIWYASADIQAQRGDLDGAETTARNVLRIGKRIGSRRVQALGAFRLSKFAAQRGRFDEAVQLLDQAEEWAKEINWTRQVAWIHYRRGANLVVAGEYAAAEAQFTTSLAAARAWNETRLIAYNLQGLAEVYAMTQRPAQALATGSRAYELLSRMGITRPRLDALIARLSSDAALLATLLGGEER